MHVDLNSSYDNRHNEVERKGFPMKTKKYCNRA